MTLSKEELSGLVGAHAMTEREVSSERDDAAFLRGMALAYATDDNEHSQKGAARLREIADNILALRSSVKMVRVKKLEWSNGIPGRMFADIYMLERLHLDDWRLMLRANEHGNWPKFIAGPFTLDEAKAAAQADYERRILSTIEAPSEGEAVAVPDELTARYWNMLPSSVDAICEPAPGTASHHLKWMLQELRTMGDSHKAMRWLGFVQGVLIMNGYTTVQAEREFTRPYLSAPTAALKGDRP
jgi:hypothetical protein